MSCLEKREEKRSFIGRYNFAYARSINSFCASFDEFYHFKPLQIKEKCLESHFGGPARVNSDKRHGPKSSDSNQMK